MYTSSDIVIEKFLVQLDLDNYKSSLSKYARICEFIKEKVDKEEIPSNAQLPSTRELSKKLKVSRSTINKAYELLILEGYIFAKKGAGFWVVEKFNNEPTNTSTDHANYPSISDRGKAFYKNVSLIHSTNEKFVAFRPGLPPLDIFPVNQWKKLSNLYWRNIKSSSLSFSDSSGIDALKKNIADYLKLIRGIKCDHEQVIIVSGSLQSLYLVGNSLINNGDRMVMENPTFPNVHSIFRSLQADIDAVPVDHEGIQVDRIKKDKTPKLVHVTPSNQYPYGIKMSFKRKKEILEWADKNEAIIIENDYDHEISNWKLRNKSLFSLDRQQRTVYLGTFNRLLHQSIRLGYMVVPYYLLDTVKALQKHSHRFVSPTNQVVMSRFIEKNHLFHHIKNVIEAAEERKEVFINEFDQHFDKAIELEKSQARSLHLLSRLPDDMPDGKLTDEFSKNNIIAHHLSKCYINDHQNGLIFGYSCVRKPDIKKKVRQIAHIYKKMTA